MTDRGTIIVNVVEVDSGERGFPDAMTLDEVIEWLEAHRQSIPEEYRAGAVCRLDATMEYDWSLPRITIEYRRPETDAEMTARVDRAKARHVAAEMEQEMQERAELERLRAKYTG